MHDLNFENALSDLIEDRDFRYINERRARFNLFEALGSVRGELRHSSFLAFLLSPGSPSWLGYEIVAAVLATGAQ